MELRLRRRPFPRPTHQVFLSFRGLPCPSITPGGSRPHSELQFPVSHQPAQLLAWIVTEKPSASKWGQVSQWQGGQKSGERARRRGPEADASGGARGFSSRLQRASQARARAAELRGRPRAGSLDPERASERPVAASGSRALEGMAVSRAGGGSAQDELRTSMCPRARGARKCGRRVGRVGSPAERRCHWSDLGQGKCHNKG